MVGIIGQHHIRPDCELTSRQRRVCRVCRKVLELRVDSRAMMIHDFEARRHLAKPGALREYVRGDVHSIAVELGTPDRPVGIMIIG